MATRQDHDTSAGRILDGLIESYLNDRARRLEQLGIAKVYLAGPMTGIPEFNFPAFKAATEDLRNLGTEVISPAEMDEQNGFEPSESGDDQDPEQYAMFLARDIQVIAEQRVQAIVVLPGWEQSGGAKTEVAFARALGLPVLLYPDLRSVKEPMSARKGFELIAGVKSGGEPTPDFDPDGGYVPPEAYREVRVTNEQTGGQKGAKRAQFSLLPWDMLWHVAELYAAGAEKYDRDNWRRGYDWHLSADALIRHFTQFWVDGEYLDPETQTPHLAAVVFHALALMFFYERYPELDDRPVVFTAKEKE